MKKGVVSIWLLVLSILVRAQTFTGPEEDIDALLDNMKAFSAAYVAADYDLIMNSYTTDASIFPPGAEIISGREAIRERWILPEGRRVLEHNIEPVSITVDGDTAYDHGHYSGISQNADQDPVSWKGKYVIVWKKVDGNWLMYLDIWNGINE